MYIKCLTMHMYLKDFLLFFFTIKTITIHNIVLMMTTAMTIPVIVGSEVELEDDDDDDPTMADDCITRRIKCHQLNADGQMVCMKIHGVIFSYIIIRIIYM